MVVKLGHTSGLIVQWEPPLSASSFGNWEVQTDGVEWRLAPPSSPEQLTAQPVAIPGLVTIGHREDDDVLIDLESCGSMTVYGDMAAAEALVRSMVLELGAGGLLSNCQVHTVGLDIDGSERLSRVRVRTEEEAITHLRAIRVQHDAVLQEAERSSMLELRSASSPEGREITVIAVRATACERLSELLEAAMPQRGIAVVVVGEAPCATSIVIENDQTAVVSPLGLVVGAAGVPRQTAAAIAVHMDRVSEALHVDVTTVPAAVEQSWGDPWSEPTHLVRVLGEPAIADTQDLGWREVEVLAFAACAGGSTTDDDLIDAVFSGRLDRGQVWDLVSGIRASAGTVLAPRNEGGNSIELAAGSLTDVQWMSRLAFRSHARDDEDAINDLVTAMQLVKGTPFAATAGFEWASTTGDMAAAYEMIERCGYLLVERAIAAGRIDDARSTLASVLAHLGPNEPLTQALMRLERAAGDTSAVESAYGDFSQRLAYLGDGAVAPAPGNGTTMLLTHATDTATAAVSIEGVPEPTTKVERRTVRPKVLLRTFGEVCVEGSTSTQALAVAFAVAAADRAMSGEDLSELTGYSRKSLSTVFTSSNELLDRTEGRLTLRDGVSDDLRHGHCLVRLAADAGQDTGRRGFDFHGDFVGFDDQHRLARFDASPSPLSHSTTVAVSWDISNLGMMTGTTTLHPPPCQLSRRFDDVLHLGHGVVFQRAVVGDGHVAPGQPHDGRVEIVERLAVGDDGRQLAAKAARLARLVHDQHPAGLAHRADDGFLVQRLERARIDHLDLDPFLGQLLRRFQRPVHHDRGGDDGQVLPSRLTSADAQGEGIRLFGHRPLGLVEQLVLDKDDRVVVADRGQQQALSRRRAWWASRP